MNKRKICVVTGSRAEYGLFYPILSKIQESNKLELQLISTSSHHSTEYGLTYKQIENDGFTIDDKINNLFSSDSNSSIVKSTAKATSLLSDSFDRLRPDIVLLLGDRYETHAAATAAMLMNIPIAHIHGGEITYCRGQCFFITFSPRGKKPPKNFAPFGREFLSLETTIYLTPSYTKAPQANNFRVYAVFH